jgi:hypothetical protein
VAGGRIAEDARMARGARRQKWIIYAGRGDQQHVSLSIEDNREFRAALQRAPAGVATVVTK